MKNELVQLAKDLAAGIMQNDYPAGSVAWKSARRQFRHLRGSETQRHLAKIGTPQSLAVRSVLKRELAQA